MKVWAVVASIYGEGGSEPEAIFSTKAAAERFADEMDLTQSIKGFEKYDVCEYELDKPGRIC